MNKNKYESMCSFFIAGALACSCALAQAQTHESSRLSSSAGLASSEPSLLAVDSLSPTLADKAIPQFAALLESIESEFGPFDARLSEPLLSAADILARDGDYTQARAFLERALHVTRINTGLYNEAQIAIVERLIDCNVAEEAWEEVDGNFRYLQLLYGRLYERGSAQWQHGIGQVSDWHVIAINNNLGEDLSDHLREANKLFAQRLALAEERGDVNEALLDVFRHNVATTAYHLRKREEGFASERAYTSLKSRYSNRDRVAVLD